MSEESPWLYASEYRGFRVAEIESLLAQARELMGIDDTDSAMRYNAEHGSEFAPYVEGLAGDAASAEFATIAAHVGFIAEHAGDANYARPLVPGPVIWSGTVHPNNAVGGDYIFLRDDVPIEPDLPWLAKFDASSIALTDGSAVAAWTNTGTGPTLEQSDATRRPVRATIDGKAAVTFDGFNDRLELTWSGSLNPATYIIAYRPTTLPVGAETDYILDSLNVSGTNRNRVWMVGTDGVHVGATTGNSGILTAPMPTVNTWNIVSVVFNGALSIFRHNGVDYSFNPGGAGSDSMVIGGPGTASVNQGLNGAVRAVRAMGSAVSLSSIKSVERAMAYDLGLTLP